MGIPIPNRVTLARAFVHSARAARLLLAGERPPPRRRRRRRKQPPPAPPPLAVRPPPVRAELGATTTAPSPSRASKSNRFRRLTRRACSASQRSRRASKPRFDLIGFNHPVRFNRDVGTRGGTERPETSRKRLRRRRSFSVFSESSSSSGSRGSRVASVSAAAASVSSPASPSASPLRFAFLRREKEPQIRRPALLRPAFLLALGFALSLDLGERALELGVPREKPARARRPCRLARASPPPPPPPPLARRRRRPSRRARLGSRACTRAATPRARTPRLARLAAAQRGELRRDGSANRRREVGLPNRNQAGLG